MARSDAGRPEGVQHLPLGRREEDGHRRRLRVAPGLRRRSRSSGMRSHRIHVGRRIGIQPSPNSTTRSNVVGPSPPIRWAGAASARGFGSRQIRSKSHELTVEARPPSSSRSPSWRGRAREAAATASCRRCRDAPSPPRSSRHRSRRAPPPDRRSSVATSLAVMMGSRSTTRQMPVPSLQALASRRRRHQGHEGVVGRPVLARQLAAARPRAPPAGGDVRVLGEPHRLEAALLERAARARREPSSTPWGTSPRRSPWWPPWGWAPTAYAIPGLDALVPRGAPSGKRPAHTSRGDDR